MAGNLQNFLKTLIYTPKNLNEPEKGYMQRDPHQDTSW